MPDNSNSETVENPKKGKNAPTPRRSEREAANKKPLIVADRKEASRAARLKLAEERARARAGMAAGDERYLTARDRGPQRRFARDFVDRRLNVGELMLPMMFLVIVLSLFNSYEMTVISYYALWIYLGLTIIDSYWMSFRLSRAITQKFGPGSREKGIRWYATMRSIQFRAMRMPKPVIKRFHKGD